MDLMVGYGKSRILSATANQFKDKRKNPKGASINGYEHAY
jgi:hypothetical protein